jgi:hypothetical protein
MHDTIVYALLKGTCDSAIPWSKQGEIAFLCPIAPTFPELLEVTQAAEGVALSVLLAAAEKLRRLSVIRRTDLNDRPVDAV